MVHGMLSDRPQSFCTPMKAKALPTWACIMISTAMKLLAPAAA